MGLQGCKNNSSPSHFPEAGWQRSCFDRATRDGLTVGVSRWGDPVVYEDIQVFQVGTIQGAEKIAARTSRRRVWQIEKMIAEFERRADDLEREILVEQNRTGIHDTAHYAYPTYAKAAALRRDNLRRSADELRAELQRSGLVSSERATLGLGTRHGDVIAARRPCRARQPLGL